MNTNPKSTPDDYMDSFGGCIWAAIACGIAFITLIVILL